MTNASPFDYLHTELPGELHQRRQSEQRLRIYMAKIVPKLRELIAEHAEATDPAEQAELRNIIQEVRATIELSTQKILYGVREPGARRSYLERYGCAAWTDAAMNALGELAPLVEVGAGAGHWQRELTARGVDCLAYDNNSTLAPPQAPVGNVLPGDETALAHHPDRTLFLCYPPDNDMAIKCLCEYKGKYLVYVGEGRGGVNASPAFFDTLDADWELVETHKLAPFARCYERMFVLKRKPKPWSSYFWGGRLR